jgi:pyruvate formate-lyase activating enzyme-like uncharacterized protein
MSSSSYNHVIGGVLKLKNSSKKKVVSNANKAGPKTRKDPKQSTDSIVSTLSPSSSVQSINYDEMAEKAISQLQKEIMTPSSAEDSASIMSSSTETLGMFKKFIEESRLSRMTPAERSFHMAQKRRQWERIQKMATKSHKEKVEVFNRYLDSLSEHFDIPRVGPG